jgi:hypothetical protein
VNLQEQKTLFDLMPADQESQQIDVLQCRQVAPL